MRLTPPARERSSSHGGSLRWHAAKWRRLQSPRRRWPCRTSRFATRAAANAASRSGAGAPCRTEMPALDALEGRLGGPRFEVVAVNIDTRDSGKPRSWLATAGVDKLGYYADPSAKVFQDLKTVGRAIGMPTTLLVDPAGCEIGTMAGPAEWAGADGVALVTAALAATRG